MAAAETKHTPEPWTRYGWNVGAKTGRPGQPGTLAQCCDEEHARRIVACVNALEGIPTVALEGGALAGLIAWVERCRDALHMDGAAQVLAKIGRVS